MNKGNAIDNSDAAIDAAIAAHTCPMCGATGITWEPKTGGFNLNADGNKESIATRDGDTLHVYYDTTINLANYNLVQIVSQNSGVCKNKIACVALKSTANITLTQYRIQIAGTNNTLNIIVTGSIHADQSISEVSDLDLFQITSGTVNLYGGTFTMTGNASITGCAPSVSGDVVIPAVVGGYPVIAIGDSAFQSCGTMTTVTIPESVQSIGDHAFSSCCSMYCSLTYSL